MQVGNLIRMLSVLWIDSYSYTVQVLNIYIIEYITDFVHRHPI